MQPIVCHFKMNTMKIKQLLKMFYILDTNIICEHVNVLNYYLKISGVTQVHISKGCG